MTLIAAARSKYLFSTLLLRLRRPRHDEAPLYVFHHIPKCGGTSLLRPLARWFRLLFDYREGWSETIHPPHDLARMRRGDCLCGHFDHGALHLANRYPGLLEDSRYQVFSFVREPLAAKLSLYKYERRMGRSPGRVEKFLFERPNYLASTFPLYLPTLEDTLNKYFYLGTIENIQLSMDNFANVIGRSRQSVPRLNVSTAGTIKLDPGLVSEFEAENSLDYALYKFVRNREQRLLSQ